MTYPSPGNNCGVRTKNGERNGRVVKVIITDKEVRLYVCMFHNKGVCIVNRTDLSGWTLHKGEISVTA